MEIQERYLMLGEIVQSPQFAYITYPLQRGANGLYELDYVTRISEIGFAANPIEYYDSFGDKHEIIASSYQPELVDHKFAVIGMMQLDNQVYPKYTLMDMTTNRKYYMFLKPHIKIKSIGKV